MGLLAMIIPAGLDQGDGASKRLPVARHESGAEVVAAPSKSAIFVGAQLKSLASLEVRVSLARADRRLPIAD